MKLINFLVLLFFSGFSFAGGTSSGKISYSLDLSESYSKYSINEKDRAWISSLVKKFNYKGAVVVFEKTSLTLVQDGKTVKGKVYQSKQHPDYFYVTNSDTMIKKGDKAPYSPGVGGFSMHSDKSLDFIVCLNCLTGGVYYFSFNSLLPWHKIGDGKVSWNGTNFSRFD